MLPNPLGWVDWRTYPGELLWPERFGPEEIESAKLTLGSYGYAGQFQQRPAPAGGGIIKTEWFRYYDPATILGGFDQQLQSWDMNFKETTTGSFVVGTVWGRIGANFYVIDMWRERAEFVTVLAAMMMMANKHPLAHLKLVEDAANGPAILSTLHHTIPGLVAVKADRSKEARLRAVAPVYEAHNVYLPRARDNPRLDTISDLFEYEHTTFPRAASDDIVDSATQALERLIPSARASEAMMAIPLGVQNEVSAILATKF